MPEDSAESVGEAAQSEAEKTKCVVIQEPRYVEADAVLEAIDNTRMSKQDVRDAVEEAAAQR